MLHFTSVSFRALNANYILSLENSTHLPVSSVPCKNPPWTLGIIFGLLQHAGQGNHCSYQLLHHLRETALLVGSPLLREKLYIVSNLHLAMMVLPILILCQAG